MQRARHWVPAGSSSPLFDIAFLSAEASPLASLGFFFYICESKEMIQMFSEDLCSNLREKPSCLCGLMLGKILSILKLACF